MENPFVYGEVVPSAAFVDLRQGGAAPFSGQVDAGALLAALTPVVLIVILIVMLAVGALQAVFLAPWAVAYRAFSHDAKPGHPVVF